MDGSVREARRIGVKLYCEKGNDLPLLDAIPIFHRWIQAAVVPGLLIDVADYSHVPNGPGILLVSHEGIYSLDESDGRRGLAYVARRPGQATFADSLTWSLCATVTACLALEREFGGRFSIRGDECRVFVNDRLAAPNTEDAANELTVEIKPVLDRLYDGTPWALVRNDDPRERLSVDVRSAAHVSFAELARRVLEMRRHEPRARHVPDVTAGQAYEMMLRASVVYLDVRTEREFEQGHPKGAVNVPIVFFDPAGGPPRPNEQFLETVMRHVPRDVTLVVGCQSGMRSRRAAEALQGAGYSNVLNVQGGFGGATGPDGHVVASGWRDAGLPVETGECGDRSYQALRAKN